MILNHCRVILKDKTIKGVSVLSNIFFLSWGIWNLYYYPHLDQFWSFVGGAFLVSCNMLYVGLMIYYSKFSRKKSDRIYTIDIENIAR